MSSTIGSILTSLRREKGISQKELARMLRKRGMDITNQGISKWENGSTQPNASQFLVLCDELGVQDISAIFLGTSDEGPLAGLNSEGRQKVNEYAAVLRASGMFAPTVEVTPIGRLRTLPIYSIASIAIVPEPQNGSCNGVARRHIIICNKLAAAVSRNGAMPPSVR